MEEEAAFVSRINDVVRPNFFVARKSKHCDRPHVQKQSSDKLVRSNTGTICIAQNLYIEAFGEYPKNDTDDIESATSSHESAVSGALFSLKVAAPSPLLNSLSVFIPLGSSFFHMYDMCMYARIRSSIFIFLSIGIRQS